MRLITLALFLIVALAGFYGFTKPLPSGLDIRSELYPITPEQVRFLADRTYRHPDDNDDVTYEHTIFDTMLENIAGASDLVMLDMFLYNGHRGKVGEIRRPLHQELTDALIASKTLHENQKTYVISDPINGMYDTVWPDHFARLENVGIPITITNLQTLPDSNPLYSALYRAGLQYVPQVGGTWLPNIFDPEAPGMHLNAYAQLLNFKANHRKVLVTGGAAGWQGIVTSMNTHDASSSHSNAALEVRDHPIITDIIRSEQAIIDFSLDPVAQLPQPNFDLPEENQLFIQLLTERAIKDAILTRVHSLDEGDQLDLAMFYLSDRNIVRSLQDADERGVEIRILLDSNQDAFGREKSGIPNRQVANELIENTSGNISVRWCVTHGEQCHSKFMLTHTSNDTELILGSANFTKRNLENRNLETNLRLVGPPTTPALADAQTFFEEQWENRDGRIYSTTYDTFADTSRWRSIWYHISEFTGMGHY